LQIDRAHGWISVRDCPRAQVVLVADRGTGPGTRTIDGRLYSEDTVPAFQKAMTSGADGFETDYWPTSDRRLVSNHDGSLDASTNGTGNIRDHDWGYVRTLTTRSGDPIPTMATIETAMDRFGGVRQQEIKQGAAFTDRLLDSLIRLDRKHVEPRDVLITASDLRTLRRINRLEPRVETGLITRSRDGRAKVAKLPPWLDVVLIDIHAADRDYADQVHTAGLALSVRNVNTSEQLQEAVALGADRVVTNRPEVLGRLC
jgi:glycerophosphoryl diester phosphodiesterase